MESFTKLEGWQKAHELTLSIYQLTDDLPKEEKYRLGDQLRLSAPSFPANIAEGKGHNTLKEYIQFLYNFRGSLEETKYHLILARDLEYIEDEEFKSLATDCNDVRKMLNGLINSLESKQNA